MGRWRSLGPAMLLALAQMMPAPVLAQASMLPMGVWPYAQQFFPGRDICMPFPLAGTLTPLTTNPPAAWRGKKLELHAVISADGALEELTLPASSGVAAFDAAAMAHVKAAWRWMKPLCGRRGVTFGFQMPRLNCDALIAETPMLNVSPSDKALLAALPGEGEAAGIFATLELRVGQDGRVADVVLAQGSGNAVRDAAMLAHVKEKWRYYALAEGCQPARDRVRIGFPHVSCAPIPMPETQTSPDDVDVQDRPRSTDLSISVIPDGTVVAATVLHSSGVAALDQAAVAHVMRTWRWRPFSCPRSPDVISGNATVGFDYAVPDPPAPKP